MSDPIKHIIGSIIGVIIAVAIIKLMDWICDTPHMSPKDRMQMDHDACKHMRISGWSEDKIQKWMHRHNGYYDKDYD